MEDKETLCIYCDKTCDVIIWNGLYNEEEESIYLCERCHRHLQRKDALALKALRIVSQRACASLARDKQPFFDRMDLSALSVVLDEDNGKEVEILISQLEEFGECEECSKPATESLAYGCLSVGLCKEHYAISWAEHPANPENCFSSDEDEDEEEEEWETIYNEDYKEKQTDEDGREYLDYLTYGGGPCGGYMAYTDNNAVYSWHFEFGFDKRRLTRLHNQKLIMRRNPDMPSRYKGAQGFQVRVVEE